MNNILIDWIKDSNSWKSAKSLNVLDRQDKEYPFCSGRMIIISHYLIKCLKL